jgi:serine/threonine protein kinase
MSDRDDTGNRRLKEDNATVEGSDSTEFEQSSTGSNYIGRVLEDRYKITDKIGQGGMGEVFRANQLTLNRNVVIKLISENQIDDRIALKRFEREAQSLTRLDHMNIVTIHDFGRDDGRAYIVMEYVDGEQLKHFVQRQGPLSGELFISIAGQLSNAVGEAHEAGLVHRDLKPSNIMLTQKNNREHLVKILDFGLAKLVSGESDVTRDDKFVGSVPYLAPEQLKSGQADERVDVYTIGIVMYYMLTGQKPFQGSNASVLYDQVNTPPPPLSARLSTIDHIPEALEQLVMECLCKEPEERPRNAREIFERLCELSDRPDPITSAYTTSPSSGDMSREGAIEASETVVKRPDSSSREMLSSSPHTESRQDDLETPVEPSVTVDRSAEMGSSSDGTTPTPNSSREVDSMPTPPSGIGEASASGARSNATSPSSPPPASSGARPTPSSAPEDERAERETTSPSGARERPAERTGSEPDDVTSSDGTVSASSSPEQSSISWTMVAGIAVGVMGLAGIAVGVMGLTGVGFVVVSSMGGEPAPEEAERATTASSTEPSGDSKESGSDEPESALAAGAPDASSGETENTSGTLRISGIDGSGMLYIDGDEIGSMPVETSISPGSHELEVRSNAGDETWSRSLTIEAGERRELQVDWPDEGASNDENDSDRPSSPSTGAPQGSEPSGARAPQRDESSSSDDSNSGAAKTSSDESSSNESNSPERQAPSKEPSEPESGGESDDEAPSDSELPARLAPSESGASGKESDDSENNSSDPPDTLLPAESSSSDTEEQDDSPEDSKDDQPKLLPVE